MSEDLVTSTNDWSDYGTDSGSVSSEGGIMIGYGWGDDEVVC